MRLNVFCDVKERKSEEVSLKEREKVKNENRNVSIDEEGNERKVI